MELVSRSAKSSTGSPGDPGKRDLAWVFGVVADRRWVRLAVLSLLLGLILFAVYFRVVVSPQLAAVSYEVKLVGASDESVILVDPEASVVRISNGQATLADLIAVDDHLLVPASAFSVELDRVDWIRVPLSEVDDRFGVLTADRVSSALDRGTKECLPADADGDAIVKLLLVQRFPVGADVGEYAICGVGVGGPVADGANVTVDEERIRANRISVPADSAVIDLLRLDDPESVLELLNRLVSPGV